MDLMKIDGKCYGIPVRGTHAHTFVQSFASEYDAFSSFAHDFHAGCILLIDTYNTLSSGLPNAIHVFREMKAKLGDRFRSFGVRLDSGDLAYLSKECRRRLDEAGLSEAIIVASNDLDEHLIRDLKAQGARIDSWGVGTNLITSRECPALGGVYKLAGIFEAGQLVPRPKISENPAKITTPGEKKLVRFHDRATGVAIVDLIMLDDEPIPAEPFEAFDPQFPWKRKLVADFIARPLLVPVFSAGRLVYQPPALAEIRRQAMADRAQFPPEIRRLVNPHEYHVDLSTKLWELRRRCIEQATAHPA
jgi:nicotinate phosphoribosyltransferase